MRLQGRMLHRMESIQERYLWVIPALLCLRNGLSRPLKQIAFSPLPLIYQCRFRDRLTPDTCCISAMAVWYISNTVQYLHLANSTENKTRGKTCLYPPLHNPCCNFLGA